MHLGALMALGLTAAAHAAPIISNGGFEAGFTDWTRADQLGGDGTFSLQSGTTSPLTGEAVPAPPAGNVAAMSDGEGPGSHVLYQDFVVPDQVILATLTFDLFIGNRDPDFFIPTPTSLDFSIAGFNQQARVDILLGGTDPFSLDPADVLLNLYQTEPGDPSVSGYTTIAMDITALLAAHTGQTLRLRFAETDNVAAFQLGVDQVDIQVPEPATALLLGGALAGLPRLRRRLHAAPHPA
jgi:hypothetical protein